MSISIPLADFTHIMTGLTSAVCKRSVPRRPVLRALLRDRRGNAVMEFGFVAAPLAALIIATLQTSLVFFAQQTLETTAEKSTRQLLTGAAQKSGLSANAFKTSVCNNLPAFMKCANVMVDVRTVTAFSNAAVSAPTITYDAGGAINNSWSFSPGGPGTINVVTIMYIWKVERGPFDFDLSTMSNSRRLLFATSVFKVEPYQ